MSGLHGGAGSRGSQRGGESEPALLYTEELWVGYRSPGILSGGSGGTEVVRGVNLTLRRGEILGLVGASGCGKSTLGRALVGLLRPSSGAVFFHGREIPQGSAGGHWADRRRLQIVFQNHAASLNPRMTVQAAVREVLEVHDPDHAGADLRVAELLDRVGLSGRVGARYPRELSGGERQRASIARALAAQPEAIVLDEPVSSLDVSIQAQVVALLLELRSELNLSYLFISHDLALVEHMSDRIVVMDQGRIVEEGSARNFGERPDHPVTVALVEANRASELAIFRPPRPLVTEGGSEGGCNSR